MHKNNLSRHRFYGKRQGNGLYSLFLSVLFPRPAYRGAIVMLVFFSWCFASPLLEFLDSATVNDTLIRVGDIARISGVENKQERQRLAQTPIGESAPASYVRFVSVNDALRAAQGSGFHVAALQSGKSGRIPVKTGYQEKNIDSFKEDIVFFIQANVIWAPADYSLTILNPRDKIICLKTPYTLTIEGPPTKCPKGNFSVQIVLAQGSRVFSVHAQCFMTVTTAVVTAASAIPRNAPCDEINCVMEKRDITHFKYAPYTKIAEVRRKRAARSIAPGTILYETMLASQPDVYRDQQVQIIVNSGSVTVTMTARAREDGTVGERIWVENEMTHKLLKAVIIASGKAQLSQGEKLL